MPAKLLVSFSMVAEWETSCISESQRLEWHTKSHSASRQLGVELAGLDWDDDKPNEDHAKGGHLAGG